MYLIVYAIIWYEQCMNCILQMNIGCFLLVSSNFLLKCINPRWDILVPQQKVPNSMTKSEVLKCKKGKDTNDGFPAKEYWVPTTSNVCTLQSTWRRPLARHPYLNPYLFRQLVSRSYKDFREVNKKPQTEDQQFFDLCSERGVFS